MQTPTIIKETIFVDTTKRVDRSDLENRICLTATFTDAGTVLPGYWEAEEYIAAKYLKGERWRVNSGNDDKGNKFLEINTKDADVKAALKSAFNKTRNQKSGVKVFLTVQIIRGTRNRIDSVTL